MTQYLFTLADVFYADDACEKVYHRFYNALAAAHPGDDPETIKWSIGDLAAISLRDALWCLAYLPDPRPRVAAIMPTVQRASAHTKDQRVHDGIAALNQWLAGDDTVNLNVIVAAAQAAYDAVYASGAPDGVATAAAAYSVLHAAQAAHAIWLEDNNDHALSAAHQAADAVWNAAADTENKATDADADYSAVIVADAIRANAARAAECEKQRADLIAAFPRTFR